MRGDKINLKKAERVCRRLDIVTRGRGIKIVGTQKSTTKRDTKGPQVVFILLDIEEMSSRHAMPDRYFGFKVKIKYAGNGKLANKKKR